MYELKPAFQRLLRPTVGTLAGIGVTANTVTIAAVVLSIVVGGCVALWPGTTWLLLLLPATLILRMALNAVDPDRNEGPGFVLVAGGIGISPLLSMLRTARDRGDMRPFLLLYANRRFDDAAFTEELDELGEHLRLEVVHVVQDPPEGWSGESGLIDDELLRRWLPARFERLQYFICGPPPMMDALEDSLSRLGVPAERIHSERLSFVS